MEKHLNLEKYEISDIGISCLTRLNTWCSERIKKYNFITPNLLTFLSLVFALFAALLFLIPDFKYLVVAAMLVFLSYFLDYSDGKIARLKKMETSFGFWFDRITDQVKLSLLILALGIRAYYIEKVNADILIVASIAIIIQIIKEFNWALFEIFRLSRCPEIDYERLVLENVKIKFSKENFLKRIIFYTSRLFAFMQYEQFIILMLFPLVVKAKITIYVYAIMSLFALVGRVIIYINILVRNESNNIGSRNRI